tara:strand:+ start:471 stop:1256 length:786 start_codon:yes stop_codon:yes gene_type:complete
LIHHWPDIEDEMKRPPLRFADNRTEGSPGNGGRWVKSGDIVVRGDIETHYSKVTESTQLHPDLMRMVEQVDPDLQGTLRIQDSEGRYQSFVLIDGCGKPTKTEWPLYSFVDSEMHYSFIDYGMHPVLFREVILDIDKFGIPFIWNTPIITMQKTPKTTSSRRAAYTAKMRAASAARNSYMARARSLGIEDPVSELVDVEKLQAMTSGYCSLCGVELSWSESWPGDFYPTIDHIIPVSKGGQHVEENLQWVHWACNLKKRDL